VNYNNSEAAKESAKGLELLREFRIAVLKKILRIEFVQRRRCSE